MVFIFYDVVFIFYGGCLIREIDEMKVDDEEATDGVNTVNELQEVLVGKVFFFMSKIDVRFFFLQ